MAYFDTKSGSLEEAIRQAVGGKINEAKVVMDLENDDPKLMKDIKGFGLKVKDLGDSGNKGYNEYEISGPQSKIDAASKKLNLQASYHEKLDPVNKSAAKKKFDDRKDKDIDNDGDVDSSDKFLHKRRKAIGKALNNADDFKPHMMYDPKTGKGYEAKKMDDHLRMKKMGYTHEKPKMEGLEDSPNPANSQHLCAKNVVHEEWGEGNPVHGQHADPDENGDIAWYDVIFEHGVEKGVSINELKVTKAESHHDHKKKKVKENYDVGTPENTKAKLDATPGQSSDDWNQQVEMMQGKNNSMREALAKMWGVEEGHNPFKEGKQSNPDNFEPFKKKGKKEDKTMTGKPMTKVDVDPDMKEKKTDK